VGKHRMHCVALIKRLQLGMLTLTHTPKMVSSKP